jgi:hypothetical protein
VKSYVQKGLDALDPALIPLGVLNNLDSQLANIESECNAFESDQSIAHLVNASNHADTLLVQFSNLPRITGLDELSGMRQAATSYRRSVAQYQRYVTAERDGLKAPINKVKDELQEVRSVIATEKSRVDSVVAELQKQFSEAEERRRQEAQVAEEKRKTQFDATEAKRQEQIRDNMKALESDSRHLLDDIEEKRVRAQDLVYVISNTGMVGGYQRVANRAFKSTVVWQAIAAASLVGLVIFAILAFLDTQGADFSWPRLAGRAFVAAAFGILAAYAARQADRSEVAEAKSRRLELALASVDPYLVSLPEEEQQRIKQDLAVTFFTAEERTPLGREVRVKGNAADLLRMALELAADLARKA